MANRQKNSIYREYRYSRGGIAAVFLGLISMLVFIILVGISAARASMLGDWSGAVGFTAFAAAFSGMSVGLGSFRESCHSYIFSKIGTLYCGLMVAVWFLTFCVGMAS
jgi:hypothetical protein